ncbi:hypothetical protein CC2G_014007 [Coprinopsis cinerea AmutBmut pab1-1]|nr:hypothetical protein CC2G_014007 [Coprinopsis cinerea AmutBmut pab1-1]
MQGDVQNGRYGSQCTVAIIPEQVRTGLPWLLQYIRVLSLRAGPFEFALSKSTSHCFLRFSVDVGLNPDRPVAEVEEEKWSSGDKGRSFRGGWLIAWEITIHELV